MSFWEDLVRSGECQGGLTAQLLALRPDSDIREAQTLLQLSEESEEEDPFLDEDRTLAIPTGHRAAESEQWNVEESDEFEETVCDILPTRLSVEDFQAQLSHNLYPNSLNLPDEKVLELIRLELYPQYPDESDETVYELALHESRLIQKSEQLGRAFHLLLTEYIEQDDLWLAALWVTGAHRDPLVRQLMASAGPASTAEHMSELGWKVWPYAGALCSAANHRPDIAGMRAGTLAMREALKRRYQLIKDRQPHLNQELDHHPTSPRGPATLPGFRWLEQ